MKKKYNIKILTGVFVIAMISSTIAAPLTANAILIPEQAQQAQVHLIPNGYGYQILWTKRWNDSEGKLYTHGKKVTTDCNNNVYTFINYKWNHTVIIKYNTSGTCLWNITVNMSGLGNVVDLTQYVERDTDMTPHNVSSIFHKKIPSGNETLDDNPVLDPHDILIDQDGNIVFLADWWKLTNNEEALDWEYVVVFKYDPNGNEIWKNKYDYFDMLIPGYDMSIDSCSNIYIPCSNYFFPYILKLAPDGSVNWFKAMGGICIDWYEPLSLILDSNENPIMTLSCHSENTSLEIMRLVKFNQITEIKTTTEIIFPWIGDDFLDAGLAIDKSDNSLFFGITNHIYKFNAQLDNCVLLCRCTTDLGWNYTINDLKVLDEKLIVCGGWIDVDDVHNYLSEVYNKNSGSKLFDMALGQLQSISPGWEDIFERYWNIFQGLSIDTQGNIVFSGGAGGMIVVKVHLINGPKTEQVLSRELHDISVSEQVI